MIARDYLGERPDIEYIAGTAEDTKLLDHSVDLIVAANAYHRFHPEKTIKEFNRILKPKGILAIFSYHDDNGFFRDTMQVSNIEQYIQRLTGTRHHVPIQYFYGDSIPSRYLFQQEHCETWDEYWGAVMSGMESPNENDDWFLAFQAAHKQRFDSISVGGRITIKYSTEVWLSQPKYIS